MRGRGVSGRAFAVDRELLLMAYEKVTPPRTIEQEELRERLFEVVRAIRGATLTQHEAAAGLAPKQAESPQPPDKPRISRNLDLF